LEKSIVKHVVVAVLDIRGTPNKVIACAAEQQWTRSGSGNAQQEVNKHEMDKDS
jgi:hypothetical protein